MMRDPDSNEVLTQDLFHILPFTSDRIAHYLCQIILRVGSSVRLGGKITAMTSSVLSVWFRMTLILAPWLCFDHADDLPAVLCTF